VNKYMQNVTALFGYAVREGLIPDSPARSLAIPAAPHQEQGRRPFTIDELNAIFRAPLYVGCRDDLDGYNTPGPQRPKRGRFWVPLLGLWTGMRLAECCQLEAEDITELDGLSIINVGGVGGNRPIKTSSARRKMPIHPELVRIGFLAHVEKVRKGGGGRLFPDLGLSQDDRGNRFQKWFGRFLRSERVGITDRKAVFHSFRHTFRDAMREAGIDEGRTNALGGWSRGQDIGARYGQGFSAKKLFDAISAIQFSGLDLAHLHSSDLLRR